MGNPIRKHTTLWAFFLLMLLLVSVSCSALATESLLSTGTFASNQQNPSVWGNWVVWEDQRNDDGSGYSDIYAYNVATGEERRLTADETYCYNPSIFADKVAWYSIDMNDGSYHIICYDLGTRSKQDLYSTFNLISSVSMSAGNIIWEENNGQSDIMMVNISDSRLSSLTIDDVTGADQQAPAIFRDIAVWQDARNGLPDIFMNNTATRTQSIITANRSNQWNPAISGHSVVWMDQQTGDWDILSYNLATKKITNVTPYNSNIFGHSNDQLNPAVYNDQVIWLDNRLRSAPGDYDIVKKNLTTGSESPVLNNQTALISSGSKPAIYDNRIVWVDDRAESNGGLKDIYLYTDGVSVTCPIASFIPLTVTGSPPLAVHFSDTSSGSPTHWHWNFGDGATSTARNPSHIYASTGTFLANLSVGNSECRNMSIDHTVSVGTPTASFIAFPNEGIAPQNIIFDRNATSGTVDSWFWDFGDSATSTDVDPSHIYTNDGTFDVSLTVANIFGSNTRTRGDYVTIKNGIRSTSTATIPGLTVVTAGSNQHLTLNSINFGTNYSLPDLWALSTKPAPSYGWQSITFITSDNAGFSNTPPVVTGNLRRVLLRTNDITPANFSAGFVAIYGDGIKTNYMIDHFTYPIGGSLQTDAWEGAFPSDEIAFLNVASHSGFSGTYIAYTLNTTRINIAIPANATVNMSVKTSWIATYPGGASEGRHHVYIIATGRDATGKYRGTVLPARYLFSDSGYDFFTASVPSSAPYLSKFALSQLSGSGNVFQMVYLGVEEHFGGDQPPETDAGTVPGTGAGTSHAPISLQVQPPLNQPLANPPAPTTKSVDLYINDQGVVTQTAVLESADNLAAIAIGQGVTALDARGNPLSSVSIDTLSASQIAQMPSADTLSFAGIAYNLQPDGATFTPAVTITFTVPDARWSQQYMVREFDAKTGSWVDLPTTHHPESSTISASVSHFCCIALFSSQMPVKVSTPGSHTTFVLPEVIPTPAASSQIGIMYNMVAFFTTILMKNLYLVLIIVAIIIALYLRGRRGRLDRIRYNL